MQDSIPVVTPDAVPELQTEWWSEFWSGVWGPQPAALLIVAALTALIGAVVTVLMTWLLQRVAAKRPRTRTQGHGMWSIAPNLRPANVDIAWALETYGRVPLEHFVQGSLFSRLWSRVNRWMLRPSSPKPAFGARDCERIPPAVESGDSGRPGGFRLKVRLHANECPEHFRRSIMWPRRPRTRTLAVCTPDRLAQLSSRVQCYLIDASYSRIRCEHDEHGPCIDIESADPIRASHGNDWRPRRKDVPVDALWLISAEESSFAGTSGSANRDWDSPWKDRYRPLLAWPLLFVIVTVAVALYLTFVDLNLHLFGVDFGLVSRARFVVLVILVYGIVLSIGVIVHALAVDLIRYLRFELSMAPQWTAGTTGCLEDSAKVRNGKEPVPVRAAE